MKKSLLLIAIIILPLISGPAHAELKASLLWSLPKSENIEAHPLYQLEYPLHKNLSIYGSYEEMLIRYSGQEAYDVEIGALGFKGEYEILGDVRLAFAIGGYFPSVERRLASSEALSYEINGIVGAGNVAKQEDSYSVGLRNAIGGSISGTMLVGGFNLTFGYRWVKFEETIMARGDTFSPHHWETVLYRDYSGPFVGIEHRF